jgi:hypothetical protein
MSRDDSKHTLLHTRFVTFLQQPQRGGCEHDAKQISDSRESILHRMHEPRSKIMRIVRFVGERVSFRERSWMLSLIVLTCALIQKVSRFAKSELKSSSRHIFVSSLARYFFASRYQLRSPFCYYNFDIVLQNLFSRRSATIGDDNVSRDLRGTSRIGNNNSPVSKMISETLSKESVK